MKRGFRLITRLWTHLGLLAGLALLVSSCWNTDNKIRGTLGASPLEMEIPETLDLSQDLKLSISGGTPPYQVEVLEGLGAFDSSSGVFVPKISGNIRLKIVDSQNKTVEKSFTVTLGPVVSRSVKSYSFQLDSDRLFFISDLDIEGHPDLYSFDLNTQTKTKLNGPPSGGKGDVYDFKLSPDLTQVVYRSDPETDSLRQLYAVSVNGGSVTKLNHTDQHVANSFLFGQSVQDDYVITPNGRVIYRDGNHDRFVDNEMRVQVVNLDGSQWSYVNPALTGGPDRSVEEFWVSPNGQWTVGRLMWWENWAFQGFAFLSDGSTSSMVNRLHDVITNFSQQLEYGNSSIRFSSNSEWIYTQMRYNFMDPTDMYRLYFTHLSVDPSSPVLLGKNYSLLSSSPDSSKIAVKEIKKVGVYIVTKDIHIMNPDGSSPFSLGEDVTKFKFTNNTQKLIFVRPSTGRLYSVQTDGTGEIVLSGVVASGGAISSINLNEAGTQVLYWSSEENGTDFHLYKVNIDGSGYQKISKQGLSKTPIKFVMSADVNFCYFSVDTDNDSKADEFYVLDIVQGKYKKISGVFPEGKILYDFFVNEDKRRIYFVVKDNILPDFDIYLAALGY